MSDLGTLERRAPTIGLAMVAVAVIAAVLGWVANERWRWGYPKRLVFDRENALVRLSTAALSDFRMYDSYDVDTLINFVVRERLLIGKTQAEVVERLGPLDFWKPEGTAPDPKAHFFSIGTVPITMHAGPPMLRCLFDDAGKCVEVTAYASW